MSYQVLARKWRPRNLQEMVGQEPVLRMLTNALLNQRLHHAYLFTGTRGVGKTTLARILAKCLNCENGIVAIPCGQCSICLAIDAGRFLDLIEVDAASRTKVEDTREILDNVQYTPSQGRFKIYLIDEVHMLSGHSFNALLKTLEEPPAHVKFILATTDPKRLPITILSRCLQFHLRHVPREQITKQLQHICESEHIAYDIPALDLLAHAADGSMRDALSLLDQAISFCRDKITTEDTHHLLGSIEQDALLRVLEALAERDGKKLLAAMTHLTELAPDFDQVLADLLTLLHEISMAQIIPNDSDCRACIKTFVQRFSAEETQLYYQIALIGRRDLPLAPSPAQGFEMTLLRMLAFQPADLPQSTNPLPQATPRLQNETKTEHTLDSNAASWSDILNALNLSGVAHVLATHCKLINFQENQINLALTSAHAALLNKKITERIEQALTTHFKKPIKLDIKVTTEDIQTPAKQYQTEQETRQSHATETIKNDTQIQKIMTMFNATLDAHSIKPVDVI